MAQCENAVLSPSFFKRCMDMDQTKATLERLKSCYRFFHLNAKSAEKAKEIVECANRLKCPDIENLESVAEECAKKLESCWETICPGQDFPLCNDALEKVCGNRKATMDLFQGTVKKMVNELIKKDLLIAAVSIFILSCLTYDCMKQLEQGNEQFAKRFQRFTEIFAAVQKTCGMTRDLVNGTGEVNMEKAALYRRLLKSHEREVQAEIDNCETQLKMMKRLRTEAGITSLLSTGFALWATHGLKAVSSVDKLFSLIKVTEVGIYGSLSVYNGYLCFQSHKLCQQYVALIDDLKNISTDISASIKSLEGHVDFSDDDRKDDQ